MTSRRERLYAMTHAERAAHVASAWGIDPEGVPAKFRTVLEAKGTELVAERELDR